MARIRSIKPDFPQSESMGSVSRDARLLFILLWTASDDEGRLRGNSRMLASLLFPYDEDSRELIESWLDQLEGQGCIRRYQVKKDSYLEICNWLNHQKIDKPTKSRIPPYEDSFARIREDSRGLSTESRGLPVGEEGKGEEGKGEEGKGEEGKGVAIASAQPAKDLSTGRPSDVKEVFDHWRSVMRTPRSSMDAKRENAIKRALKTYSVADLCTAIVGCSKSEFHMGKNETGTVYNDIGLILRDAGKIEQFMRMSANTGGDSKMDRASENIRAFAEGDF